MITLNQFGEILWDIWDEPEALQELESGSLANFDDLHRCYVTWPTSLPRLKSFLEFINAYELKLHPTLQAWLQTPEKLVEFFWLNRLAMSRAETYPGRLPGRLKEYLNPLQQAAAAYAAHVRCSFIADPKPEDRRAAALGAICLLRGWPVILVCRREERDLWETQARRILPDDSAFLNLSQVNLRTPEKSVWFVQYDELHAGFRPPPPEVKYRTTLVDHADWIKHPNSQRSARVAEIAVRSQYRFLLTHFPVDLAPRDLLEPLNILGQQANFERLLGFLKNITPNPAYNRWIYQGEYLDHLEKLYYQLRTTCLVRRGNDPGLSVQRNIVRVGLAQEFPEWVNPADVKSEWRELGLKKLPAVITWLKTFLTKQPGKVLIIAYHNQVVEEIAQQLGILAIYGGVASEARRETIIQSFLSPEGPPALVVASRAGISWKLPAVGTVILAELLITPQDYFGILDSLQDAQEQKQARRQLLVYLLVSNSSQDWGAMECLKLRIADDQRVLDQTQENRN